jgi:putative membrane protein
MIACNNNGNGSMSSGSDSTKMDSASTGMMDSSHSMKDSAMAMVTTPEQDFINIAVPGNMKEIAWLNAGMLRGNKAVMKDAAMMLKDHKKIGANVAAYLKTRAMLKVPSVDTSDVVNIDEKSGNEWNKAWADKMVADHSDLLTHLHATENATKDPDLKKLVAATIPIVESHLAMAKALQSSIK